MDAIDYAVAYVKHGVRLAEYHKQVQTLCASLNNAEAAVDKLYNQLPDGMKHCIIEFKTCEVGHGWLTATNWVQHGCPHCEKNKLRDALIVCQQVLRAGPTNGKDLSYELGLAREALKGT